MTSPRIRLATVALCAALSTSACVYALAPPTPADSRFAPERVVALTPGMKAEAVLPVVPASAILPRKGGWAGAASDALWRNPGLFLLIPFIDQAAVWLDQRIQTTEFNAEQALSKDTVPVDVDAVVFWQIHDPERAALEITDLSLIHI